MEHALSNAAFTTDFSAPSQSSRSLVTTAGSVAEAMTICDEKAFDAVVSDIAMPFEDGFARSHAFAVAVTFPRWR